MIVGCIYHGQSWNWSRAYLKVLSATTIKPALMSPSKKVLLLAQKEVPSLDELTINMSGVE